MKTSVVEVNVENLAEHLKAIPAGTKLTLIVENYFGALVESKVTTCGKIRHHGYYRPGGSWGLYRINDEEKECFELLVRPYRSRGQYWVKIGFTIRDYRLEWGQG